MAEIKYIRHIAFTHDELAGLNPLLMKGEMACVIDNNGKVKEIKIGAGRYNDLDPITDVYPYEDIVTNQIGDVVAGSLQYDRKLIDIVRDMISPYLSPTVTNILNDAQGENKRDAILEIGLTLSSIVQFVFTIINQDNMSETDPLEIESQGLLDENNPYPNAVISLSPIALTKPESTTTFTIRGRARDNRGDFSPYFSSTISFIPRIIWGSSEEEDFELTPPATEKPINDLNLVGGGDTLSSSYSRTYEISVGNYGYVLIPSMIDQTGISWVEVTDPNSPANIGMVNLGTININNGVGTYLYTKWRTPFSGINGVKLKPQ